MHVEHLAPGTQNLVVVTFFKIKPKTCSKLFYSLYLIWYALQPWWGRWGKWSSLYFTQGLVKTHFPSWQVKNRDLNTGLMTAGQFAFFTRKPHISSKSKECTHGLGKKLQWRSWKIMERRILINPQVKKKKTVPLKFPFCGHSWF